MTVNNEWVTVTPQIASAWLTKYPNELPLPIGINIPFSAYSSLNIPSPTVTPTATPFFSNVRSGGGVYYLLPINVLVKFKTLRDKILTKKQHRRLHPLV